ncbi:MOSC domain-containing protein [Marihabitans asiaticum]|uniref:MOSC domain-containing protein n=1 Tax=Marihabitans asiaticum TaxID=415218 RepID=A0A560WE83_9MICO|nr:MOSC domain-containing protein [Marihabitans asiaticum]TWD15983.1 MOSC domain-containing protein [Marihabitans asiaticum]
MSWSSPLVLTSRASLRQLQDWANEEAKRRGDPAGEDLAMGRFRPNVVIDGDLPFAEDQWQRVRLGEVTYRVSALCDRCAVTSVDPVTGEAGPEPLRTLSVRRRWDAATWFGLRLVPEGPGWLCIGDEVQPRRADGPGRDASPLPQHLGQQRSRPRP